MWLLPVALYFAQSAPSAYATDGPIRPLSDGEKAGIWAGSLGLGVGAQLIPAKRSVPDRYRGYRANALDRWWRARIHGTEGYQSNFLDNSRGSLAAPLAGALLMAAIDINRREFSRDLPFFVAGAVATGAVTDLAKRIVHRPRPYCQEGGVLPPGHTPTDGYHTESFYSGHSSQAFFAASFVNNRLRRHMRQEWRREEYRSWRWTAPLLTYGWATVVGWSRMHADKHHFTDVCTGALVGYALGEVFYRLCYEPGRTAAPWNGEAPELFKLRWTF